METVETEGDEAEGPPRMGDRVDEKTEAGLSEGTETGFGTLTPWYAVRVKPNYEKPVAAALRGKGLEEFLPLFRSKRKWSDRVKVMDLPLFPGYVFCRLNLEARMPLITTPGFLYIVGVGKNPEPVDEAEIQAIQSVLRAGVGVAPWPSLVVGQKVQLKQGPLRGLVGVLTKIAANQIRMYVAVTLLKRSISVEVAPDWIQAVEEKTTTGAGAAGRTEGAQSGSKTQRPS
jgi:transcription termination/antitermination protein NusG